jgi:translocation and assembly module TamB
LQLEIAPAVSAVGGWSSQLSEGRVQGGIRYTGPADLLFTFAMLPDQHLSGPVALAADISCTLSDPCLDGVLGGRSMVYENGRYGTRLTRMAVNGRFTGDRLEIDQLTANAGEGTISGKGAVSLSSASGYPANVSLDLQNARLADSDQLRAAATGSLTLVKPANQSPVLSGTITLPATRYQMVRQGAARVPVLEGVHFKQIGPARMTGDSAPPSAGFGSIDLNLHIVAPNRFTVSGMGLESEWSADLRVTGTSDAPHLIGSATLRRGSLEFAGKSFTLTEGRIVFPGGGIDDAQLLVSGEETVDNITVLLNVSGSASRPQIGFSSTPGLPQDEILSRVLFGSSVGNLSGVEALQLAASLNSLRGSGNGLNPLGKLQAATGFDRLRILAADQTQGRGTALALGKHIGDRLYIELVTDARGYTATQIEIALNRSLSLLSQAGGANSANVGFRFRKTY